MAATSKQLSPGDLDRLRSHLIAKRDALIDARRAGAEVARDVGDDEIEDADIAARKSAQEDALLLARFDAGLLDEIEHALGKIEAGSYGVSEDSGEPIPRERLDALPWARRTAQEEERRSRRG